MPHLKPKKIHGHTYWYVVESRRQGRRVRTRTLAYLGRAEDVLARWQGQDAPEEHLRSYSHGGVAVFLSLADRLGVAELIDGYVRPPRPSRPVRRLLSVGQTLVLAAVGRALHPTSKRGWAGWARHTTLPFLWKFPPEAITSEFFWDQMDRLPVEALPAIQAELGRRVLKTFGLSTQTLYYDTTNYFTFIDSRNTHCDLPQRGKNKQKRNDLRQFQMGLLVAQDGWVPLLAQFFRGNHNDVTTFPAALAGIRRHCEALGLSPEGVTLVADKGNLSEANGRKLEASGLGHVMSLVPSHYKAWTERPLEEFVLCRVAEAGEMRVLRGRERVGGTERTVVVLDSPSLRDGQLRGLEQQLQPVMLGLSRLQQALRTSPRRRRRDAVERQLQRVLAPAVIRDLTRYALTECPGRPGYWELDWWLDVEAFHHLRTRVYGRRMLASNREDWATEALIGAYWGAAEAELVFRQSKDVEYLALRPQYHWTDQKIQVHAFCCAIVGHVLASLVRRQARGMGYTEDLDGLLGMLAHVRMVLRTERRRRAGRPRVRWQLEETDPEALRLYESLVAPAYVLGPTPPNA